MVNLSWVVGSVGGGGEKFIQISRVKVPHSVTLSEYPNWDKFRAQRLVT